MNFGVCIFLQGNKEGRLMFENMTPGAIVLGTWGGSERAGSNRTQESSLLYQVLSFFNSICSVIVDVRHRDFEKEVGSLNQSLKA